MCTTESLCSAEIDFVISKQDSLHTYSSLHAAHKVFLIAALLVVVQSGHPHCIATNDALTL